MVTLSYVECLPLDVRVGCESWSEKPSICNSCQSMIVVIGWSGLRDLFGTEFALQSYTIRWVLFVLLRLRLPERKSFVVEERLCCRRIVFECEKLGYESNLRDERRGVDCTRGVKCAD
ncbi:hypothetical protein BAUCODRAFT_335708 [Baudoinia panamericana UAMH 10762]|uniref:Uncharacterized protein n=1 Tax=Baudoinia panamericana (strain UAMH 10762) TaxID=717646 RepID=M2MHY1_BAUPA|nr:uncharacterized protein BAUCODRAFT_335708 [Baudoinia panamericana UAMH 10762]EMC90868.1 hypothetical protein BAUCODRAFT_335708 [Baudoinia panamericana UAMH 10762]